MRQEERTLLLLCCPLGREIRPLNAREYRELTLTLPAGSPEPDAAALLRLGFDCATAQRIEALLQGSVERYLPPSVSVVTALSDGFPARLNLLRNACPPALFCVGETRLLAKPCVALVGSRRIRPENRRFAAAIGTLAAREGFVLVSGGAAGADTAAQEACLAAGGSVICFVPDALLNHPPRANVLYCSDEGYEFAFTAVRALRRNHLIHALAETVFVAQCEHGRGGSWGGAQYNLQHGLSALCVFRDGSEAALSLIAAGAKPLASPPLSLSALWQTQLSIFD